ncbi:MAG TPA: hypothetical protein P5031_07575 [Candidatus Syntrophosphaera sp.]|mgnify:FL=1|nr:hypothetical protein [Candidatus Syntrophosphaera sp.]
MKIKVNNDIVAEVRIVKKMVCRAGAAYWTVDYMIDGVCIHSADTGAIYGEPNPIAMLDRSIDWIEPHYQDIPDPDPMPADLGTPSNPGGSGSYNGRPAWWTNKSKTHRQAIIDAAAQIIE